MAMGYKLIELSLIAARMAYFGSIVDRRLPK